jgi:RNA polymerase sigma-70 factor (sigma-E family)
VNLPARIDPAVLDRAQNAVRKAADHPEHADEAQAMAAGILQLRAAGGDTDLLPADSAGAAAGRFFQLVAASSLGDHEARAAQNLDRPTAHLARVYQEHYRALLGLAMMLLDDPMSCEDVVQEAFTRVHAARRQVRDPDKILAYLRQSVVNLSRSALRRRAFLRLRRGVHWPDAASAEEEAYALLERDALRDALRHLQRRQREVLVLRYYADLTEAQIADTLGISIGSVKAYGSRGLASLRAIMDTHT